jgi:regulator of replication initiation timing
MSRTATPADVQPIDRLEEKVRQLVALIDTLRSERSKAVDDAARLQREIEGLKARLADATSATSEVTTLREEREVIRNRVVQMITQIDKLNL